MKIKDDAQDFQEDSASEQYIPKEIATTHLYRHFWKTTETPLMVDTPG